MELLILVVLFFLVAEVAEGERRHKDWVKFLVVSAAKVKFPDLLFLFVMETRKKGVPVAVTFGGRSCRWGAEVLLLGVSSRRRICRHSSRSKGGHSHLRRW
jgi:sugar/nucleoside kinase (ribokinase family)